MREGIKINCLTQILLFKKCLPNSHIQPNIVIVIIKMWVLDASYQNTQCLNRYPCALHLSPILPDINPSDFYFWCHIKDLVYKTKPKDLLSPKKFHMWFIFKHKNEVLESITLSIKHLYYVLLYTNRSYNFLQRLKHNFCSKL